MAALLTRDRVLTPQEVINTICGLLGCLENFDLDDRVNAINELREVISSYSPFKSEPVDFVKWVPSSSVEANDYNPNSVAPPEMELLRISIMSDGYTQPIVSMQDGDAYTVVDGFHRNRVGKECDGVRERTHGYLPLVQIRGERTGKADRIAATIRHNRARGKHQVSAMSDIVVELKNRNWSDERIARELGMEQDEVLRLCQITGLADLFSDQAFSKSWDVEGAVTESDFQELTDDVSTYGEAEFRNVHTGGDDRVFHTFDKWECHKAGFYSPTKDGMKKEECEEIYRNFLCDIPKFEKALNRVLTEWPNSCEHYLTNFSMNRIAWLGQAAVCIDMGIPSSFRGGFSLLTEDQQTKANECALVYLNRWLENNGREPLSMDVAYSSRQSDIY